MIIQDVMEELADGRLSIDEAVNQLVGVDEGLSDILKKGKKAIAPLALSGALVGSFGAGEMSGYQRGLEGGAYDVQSGYNAGRVHNMSNTAPGIMPRREGFSTGYNLGYKATKAVKTSFSRGYKAGTETFGGAKALTKATQGSTKLKPGATHGSSIYPYYGSLGSTYRHTAGDRKDYFARNPVDVKPSSGAGQTVAKAFTGKKGKK